MSIGVSSLRLVTQMLGCERKLDFTICGVLHVNLGAEPTIVLPF